MKGEESFDKSIIMVSSDEDDCSASSMTPHSPSYLKTLFLQKKDAFVSGLTILLLLSAVVTGIVYASTQGKGRSKGGTTERVFQRASLPYFNASIVEGYGNCQDLKDDLESAVKFIVDVQIDINANQKFRNQYGYYGGWIPRGGFLGGDGVMIMEDSGAEESVTSGGKEESSGASYKGEGEDSFGTNNQVDGVEEADLIKSDGSIVYAAYGDQIVVWNATTGVELSRILLPTEDEDGVPICDDDSVSSSSRLKDGVKCYESYQWNRMTVSSLLLHNNRLVVIATAPFVLGQMDEQYILQGYHHTRVFTYDILLLSSTSNPADADPKVQFNLLARKGKVIKLL